MTTTQTAEALQDADLAQTDLAIVTAALDELTERIELDRLDVLDRAEIAADVLPRLTALAAYFLDLVTA